METLGAVPDIPTFDGEPVPVSRNPLTSWTRPLQLLPSPGTEFPVRYETSQMRSFQTEDSRIKLDVGESSVAEILIEIFDQHNPVGAIIGPSYLGYLRHLDIGRSSHKELLGALAERWWDTTNTFHFS
ncbi:hypothetical protein JCGZ_00184 [Jatropha curcas]|uniref:Aminotransferase-like plant mobile domain-containing protein n=1 Tax=Jatropha curcas TaxID=180498 RepID=A0A067JUP2_JATCU|nr:hypothetical protein JCGZ_00184 [Jatropha curcas]